MNNPNPAVNNTDIIYHEYDNPTTLSDINPVNNTYKDIDEVMSAIQQPTISKFNFSQSESLRNRINIRGNIRKTLIILSIISLLIGLITLHITIQNVEIVPINSKPSNEALVITSSRSPFYVRYDNQVFYSKNKNNVHLVDMGENVNKGEVEVGPYLDLGFYKVLSLQPKKYPINRSYNLPTLSISSNQYITTLTGKYDLTIQTKSPYFKLYNQDQLIYETNSNSNQCQKTNNTLSCQYETNANTNLELSLRLQDEYGNQSPTVNQLLILVPFNDFACRVTNTLPKKASCLGSKDGTINYNGLTKPYIAKTQAILDLPIKPKDKNIKGVMTDKHGLVNTFEILI
jgi:hypothetical protein